MDQKQRAKSGDKDRESCLALDKDMALCRVLVKAAEDESESSLLTGALVVRPV